MCVDGAMLGGAFGLVAARAAAAVEGRIAVDLLQQRIPAIRYTAAHHPQRAGFADFGSDLPMGMNLQGPRIAKAGGGKSAYGPKQRSRDCGRHHVYYRS